MHTLRTRALIVTVSTVLLSLSSVAFAQDGTLETDARASSIQAIGAKVTGEHTLTFSNFVGEAKVDGTGVKGLSFTVQVSDFSTEMGDSEWGQKLSGHLRSADFFDVGKYPTASFESTEIKAQKSKDGTHMVTGKMTLRGKTLLVSFPATLSVTKGAVSGKAEFTINRKDFGIVYAGKADDLIKDLVLLKIALNFKR